MIDYSLLARKAFVLEDRVLIWKFRQGSRDALRRIYEKYADDLLSVAVNLLHDAHAADLHHHLESAGVKEISNQYAGLIAKYGIGRVSAPSAGR